jgi:protein TonB
MKPILTLCFNLMILFSFSQKQEKESFYVFADNWKPTVLDSAKYLLCIHEKEDGNWEWDYYDLWGPMLKMETYTDHDGSRLNGRTCYYNKEGYLDSIGRYQQGKKEGSFYKLDHVHDSVRWVTEYIYKEDRLEQTIDLLADSNERKAMEKDSANNKESKYFGGVKSWQKFLLRNLKYPDRALTKELEGDVRVCFVVDENGAVQDPFLQKSREYSLDKESLRIIKKSGKWVPGRKHGEIVKTYKVQPINFRLK